MPLDFVLLVGVVWSICAVLIYGLNFAYFQREFSALSASRYREDIGNAILWVMFVGLFGPIGLLITYLLSGLGKHGLKFV